jgi:hypothetical protein
VLSAPFAFASPAFVPEYWTPKRIACFLAGPEDILFSFANGVLVWLLAVAPVLGFIQPHFDRTRMLRTFFAWTIIGFAISTLVQAAGLTIWGGTVVACAAVSLLVLQRRPALWSVAVRGTIGFTAFYTLLLVGTFTVWPHFLDQWNAAALSGIFLIVVPLEEVVWAAGYGAAWPLIMAHAFGFRPASAGRTSNSRLAKALVPPDTEAMPTGPEPPSA